jgi:hypothetical protein
MSSFITGFGQAVGGKGFDLAGSRYRRRLGNFNLEGGPHSSTPKSVNASKSLLKPPNQEPSTR